MTQYMEMLDRLKDIQIVKFFSHLYSESGFAPLFRDLQGRAEHGTMNSLGRELLIWAIILAAGAFIIDQVFYWTRPGQVELAREMWWGVRDGAISLKDAVRTLAARTKTAVRHGGTEPPRGRR